MEGMRGNHRGKSEATLLLFLRANDTEIDKDIDVLYLVSCHKDCDADCSN